MKLIKSRNYSNVGRILFKTPDEDLINGLKVLEDDTSAVDLITICLKWGSCDIYVNNGVDELVLADVTSLLIGSELNIVGAGIVKPNNGIGESSSVRKKDESGVVEPNTDVGDGGEVDAENGDQVDVEDGSHTDMLYDVTFLSDDDDEVREARENIM